MIADHLTGIEKFEADLWKIADDLRANSGLASNEYFMPIMGILFLRHATNRYYEALKSIEADKAAGKMPDRPLVEADFRRRRALMLPQAARYDTLLKSPKGGKLGEALTKAMDAVEEHFPPLAGQLPKDYERFDDELLERMLRTFDSEALRSQSVRDLLRWFLAAGNRLLGVVYKSANTSMLSTGPMTPPAAVTWTERTPCWAVSSEPIFTVGQDVRLARLRPRIRLAVLATESSDRIGDVSRPKPGLMA